MALAAAPDLERLVRREHGNPHGVLGVHPADGGVVVRAFRPAAAAVRAVTAGNETVELQQVHPGGVFEGIVANAELPLAYKLEVDYGESGTITIDDPYRFLPTVGELDLHLVGEGRHEELWTEARRPRDRASTACAARRSASGRRRPRRSPWSATSTSGTAACTRCARSARPAIWELFLPGVDAGAHYKYEILAPTGEIRLKADPLAFATEVPPKTASVVHDSTHAWADQAVADRAPARASRSRARCRSTRSTSAPGG